MAVLVVGLAPITSHMVDVQVHEREVEDLFCELDAHQRRTRSLIKSLPSVAA
jgi:hypothetical protein